MPIVVVAIRFVTAAVLLTATLFFIAGDPVEVRDTIPTRLDDTQFWQMITEFSEAGGYFRSDNFLSNESGYQQVIPSLRKSIQRGGVYLGVGPEQNFTYVVGFEPKIAFVVDIRRQNMLQHLLYKALMEMSVDRAEFLSRLFSRPRPAFLHASPDPEELVRAYRDAAPSENLLESNASMVLDYLENTKGFGLSSADEAAVRYVYRAFFDAGPDMSYTFLGGYGGFTMPTYGELMTETDGRTHNWHFLATEDQYQMVRRLQKNNLIVPLVGDFAGPKAIRSVAEYLKEHGATVSVFYTSNVEQYLFQDDENWQRFYGNVETLPLDSSSTFIRYVLNSWRFSRRSRTVFASMDDSVRAFERGRIRSYFDVIGMSR